MVTSHNRVLGSRPSALSCVYRTAMNDRYIYCALYPSGAPIPLASRRWPSDRSRRQPPLRPEPIGASARGHLLGVRGRGRDRRTSAQKGVAGGRDRGRWCRDVPGLWCRRCGAETRGGSPPGDNGSSAITSTHVVLERHARLGNTERLADLTVPRPWRRTERGGSRGLRKDHDIEPGVQVS